MSKIIIEKINETYIRVISEPSIMMELSDYFTFDVPGAKFTPSYRNKIWDGKYRMLNTLTGLIYSGIIHYIEDFCNKREYELEYTTEFSSTEFSIKEANDFIKKLNLTLEPREYQIDAFVRSIRNNRNLTLLPTGSGKSLNLYLLTRYYNKKTLIIVPTTSLIHQLSSDFISYGYEHPENIHKIFSGQEKEPYKVHIISETGKEYMFDGNENIKILNSDTIYKKAKDITINDEIDDRWLLKYYKQ